MRIMKMAHLKGYTRCEVVLLTKSSLPTLENLLDTLDELPGKEWRDIRLLGYGGKAKRLENERLTKDIVEKLPERIMREFRWKDAYKTEEEWIDFFENQLDETKPHHYYLKLNLNEASIGAIESKSCDEIMNDLESRTRRAYEAIPSIKELCQRYGDRQNTRMYRAIMDHSCIQHSCELEHVWLDRFLKENPLDFERELTWFTLP
jgi:hypothetical protein